MIDTFSEFRSFLQTLFPPSLRSKRGGVIIIRCGVGVSPKMYTRLQYIFTRFGHILYAFLVYLCCAAGQRPAKPRAPGAGARAALRQGGARARAAFARTAGSRRRQGRQWESGEWATRVRQQAGGKQLAAGGSSQAAATENQPIRCLLRLMEF